MHTNHIQWIYYPKSSKATELAYQVVSAFEAVHDRIDSHRYELNSNSVLGHVTDGLLTLGFQVELGKTWENKILVGQMA